MICSDLFWPKWVSIWILPFDKMVMEQPLGMLSPKLATPFVDGSILHVGGIPNVHGGFINILCP